MWDPSPENTKFSAAFVVLEKNRSLKINCPLEGKCCKPDKSRTPFWHVDCSVHMTFFLKKASYCIRTTGVARQTQLFWLLTSANSVWLGLINLCSFSLAHTSLPILRKPCGVIWGLSRLVFMCYWRSWSFLARKALHHCTPPVPSWVRPLRSEPRLCLRVLTWTSLAWLHFGASTPNTAWLMLMKQSCFLESHLATAGKWWVQFFFFFSVSVKFYSYIESQEI